MGAMQAQDYPASLWAMGLRCKDGTTIKDIENAIAKRKISRTWLMRGTLHFATSSDIHWMLKLFAPRLLSTAMVRDRHLGLSDKVVEKTKTMFYNALKGGKHLTRKEMYKVLEKAGIKSNNGLGSNLGYHMLYRAAWDGLICFGPYEGREQTFVLLDEHITRRNELSQEQANAELALRDFSSHGPATIKDYVWWSGLKVSDARIGIEHMKSKLAEESIDGITYYMPKHIPKLRSNDNSVHLLPAFDEYLVSYADRSAMLSNPELQRTLKNTINDYKKPAIIYSNGIFVPVIVVNGEVVGTWSRKIVKDKVVVALKHYVKLNKDNMKGIREEAERYGRFLGMDAILK
ncbi:MAG: winged helix DNA-binding domain-containing protein [Candidatus Micrarchaeaceae archaeon]